MELLILFQSLRGDLNFLELHIIIYMWTKTEYFVSAVLCT